MYLLKYILCLLILFFSGVVLYWGITTEYGWLVSIPHYIVAFIMFGCAMIVPFLKIKRWTKEDRKKNFEKIRPKGILLFVLKYGFLYFSLPVNLVMAALTTEKLRYQSFFDFLVTNVITTISMSF